MPTGLDLRASLKRRHFYYLAGLTFICSIYFVFYLEWRAFSDIIDVSSPEEAEAVVPPDVQAEVPAEDSEAPPLQAVQGLPPLYSQFHDAELRLPQQDWNQSDPGPNEKFLFVAGHTRALGWGNAVQEHILNAYLAYKAGRSSVFAALSCVSRMLTTNAAASSSGTSHGTTMAPYTLIMRTPAS
ncbi:hypothetical protein FKP32DRAFT_164794 [Trametes sanguinea]|nr:hypothetical protein FKP32DRAFT_164794 [Trametes sanguinea]